MLKFVLKNGDFAFLLQDQDLPEPFICHTDSSIFRYKIGARFDVTTINWNDLNVVIEIKPVSEQRLPKCKCCEKLSSLDVTSKKNEELKTVLRDLIQKISTEELRETKSEIQFGLTHTISLAHALSLRDLYGHDVRVACNECGAEWSLIGAHERSAWPEWDKITEGFRFEA